MMSARDANPIFFNNKNKDWTSRTLASPQTPYVQQHLIFALPPKSGRHMCINIDSDLGSYKNEPNIRE